VPTAVREALMVLVEHVPGETDLAEVVGAADLVGRLADSLDRRQ
jgi:predicted RNA-binding protein with PUA domain